jgi:hypothetical protein
MQEDSSAAAVYRASLCSFQNCGSSFRSTFLDTVSRYLDWMTEGKLLLLASRRVEEEKGDEWLGLL